MPREVACILSGSSAAAVIARPGRLSTEQGHTRAMATLASVPLPKLIETVRRGYSIHAFLNDLVAGVTVGLVALPLAMAFAIASGVPPQNGLYCAVVAGFIISALGGSRTQIGGPTGAFVVVVAGIVSAYGLDGLFMCTLMAGVILILLGVTGLGTAVKFIPRSVVIGFTNGIGVLIASTQIRDFFGLQLATVAGDFLARAKALIEHAGTASGTATALATATVVAILALRTVSRRIPGSILALLLGSAIVLATGLSVETVGTRFGGVPSGLPVFQVPRFRADLILTLLSPALTVAMLGAIESLLSAVVSDRMSGDRHDPNVELTAQGIANVVSPLFGGLPATGAIARTATNIQSGARTPIAGMTHARDVTADLAVCRSACTTHPAGNSRRHPDDRGLRHGRMARDSGSGEAGPGRSGGLVHHLRPDRVRRSNGGR